MISTWEFHELMASKATPPFGFLGQEMLAKWPDFQTLRSVALADDTFHEVAEPWMFGRRKPVASAQGAVSQGMADPAGRASDPPRVLLADDNRDYQRVLARQLTMLGLEVLAVKNGRDAVELGLAARAAGHPFDLILMDLEMPILDGYEAIRRLRSGGFQGPILALSAHSSDDHRGDCLKLGCSDCLVKPIDFLALASLVCKYIPDVPLPRGFLESKR